MPYDPAIEMFRPEQRTQFYPQEEGHPLEQTVAYRTAINQGRNHAQALTIAAQAQQRQYDAAGRRFSDYMAQGDAGYQHWLDRQIDNAPEAAVDSVQQAMDPDLQSRQAIAANNARLRGEDSRTIGNTERLLSNPGMHFGRGGGDWASVWQNQMTPRDNLFGALGRSQVDAFRGYGNQLSNLYNSPSGPLGQMQAAAAVTAPSRANRDIAAMQTSADRDIARMRYGTMNNIFGSLMNRMGGGIGTKPISEVNTDYGAFAKLQPTSAKKYMGRR